MRPMVCIRHPVAARGHWQIEMTGTTERDETEESPFVLFAKVDMRIHEDTYEALADE